MWKVNIIEAERGWGRKVDDVKMFPTKEEAQAFITKYNADNPALENGRAPDWYMQAEGPYSA